MVGYGFENVNLNPTQVFSAHNWTLKKNQLEGPPFTDHMLAICKVEFLVEHKAPNTSSYTRKKDSKGKNPRAKSGHRKQPTFSKHYHLSKIEATKVVRLDKEDQKTTGSPTSLRVTSEGGSNPHLSSKHDVSAKSKDGADSEISAPKDSISQTTKQTKSTSEAVGLLRTISHQRTFRSSSLTFFLSRRCRFDLSLSKHSSALLQLSFQVMKVKLRV
ncbi:hypothetical protein Tco_1185544 [Tanacetum coccineum]